MKHTLHGKLPMYRKLAEGREFSKCHIVFASKNIGNETVMREIVGFTWQDTESFIFKYFKSVTTLDDKLLYQLCSSSESGGLRQITSSKNKENHNREGGFDTRS